jgi:mono/diheme cytochrome c family protein
MLSWKSAVAVATLAAAFSSARAADAAIDYTRDVKPILKQHCYRCHGASQQKGGLRADTVAFLKEGGDVGPGLKPGDAKASLIIQAILGQHEDISQMPYKKPPLADADVAKISAWINAGAPGPENEEPEKDLHWAFVAPVRPDEPAVSRAEWARNPIDRFILARLDQDKIAPAPEADRIALLRRVSLDLTGLPPSPTEVADFLADRSPGAYERVVDRLLASPHHGERWARPWLDVARYADSNGYSIDAPRQIWKYRDWVVSALNRDLPYDQFVIEQLAGDLLPQATVEQRIATGFNRNTQINKEGGIDPEQFRIEGILDRVNTFGTAFLGLTVSCAQCHDHKFDPVSQKEYYSLFAFFNNTVDDGHGDNRIGGMLVFQEDGTPDARHGDEIVAAREALRLMLETKGEIVEQWRAALTPEDRAKLKPSSLRAAADVPWDKQTFAQRRATYSAARPGDTEFRTKSSELSRLERRDTGAISTLVMQELPQPRKSHLFIKGDFTRLGEPVQPGTPAILPPLPARETLNRLDLARWLFDPAHPLTARVMVNRIWQQYFGRGIVETENDFGTQGIPPTHPALLDWLATEFKARQWSMKAMHRLIVTSATYRQASRARPDLEIVDPVNRLLARQSRLRLDAEVVRDVALAASGLLAPKLGGPPVYPPQPDGVMNLGQVRREWKPSEGPDRYRRGLYTHFWRATPHPALAVFDAADGFSACTRRLRSNTPLQALTLLNDRQFFEFAGALAERIEREGGPDEAGRIDLAFKLCVARPPTADEARRVSELLRQVQAPAGDTPAATPREAWITVARVLLNLDETITRE